MEAIILCGVQGSGKTTLYRDRFAATHEHVSLDVLGSRAREAALIAECLEEGRPFVVDNTNPTVADRARYVDAARDGRLQGDRLPGARATAGREHVGAGRRPPPPRARLVRPAPEEGFDELWHAAPAPAAAGGSSRC